MNAPHIPGRRYLLWPILITSLLSLEARANPLYTATDCMNFPVTRDSGVCVSGNGPDGTSYFTVVDIPQGPFVISGGATNSGANTSLPTLTQTAGVGAGTFGPFFATADSKFWDTFTFSGVPDGALATLTFSSTFFATGGGAGSALVSIDDGGQAYTLAWNAPFPGWQSPLSVNMPIANGVPVKISANIYAEAPWYGSSAVTDPWSFTLPDGVTYIAGSGLQEFPLGGGTGGGGGTQTPEPGSSSLFLAAATGFFALRRKLAHSSEGRRPAFSREVATDGNSRRLLACLPDLRPGCLH
jgi:hypothetical protein